MKARLILLSFTGAALIGVAATGCAQGARSEALSPTAAQPTSTVAAAPVPAVAVAAPATPTSTAAPLPSTIAPTTTPTTEPPPSTTAAPPEPIPFQIDPAEVDADAKQLGGDIALALTTYDPGTPLREVAGAVVADPERRQLLEAAAAPLFHPDRWSRGTVIYPQLGGRTNSATSIMVVVRQDVGSGAQVELSETRTLDIRLRLVDGEWRFEELASAGGTRLERPTDLPAEAVAVLDDPRIELPDSARWDIYRGHTSPTLLRLMSELADRTPFGVVVLASGHPHNVFATDRTSNHTVGRAVDVYRLDDVRVIDDRDEGSFTRDTLQWLYARTDVNKLGGPWALDGAGGRSFTDVVHQDHLHISVRR